MHFTRKGAWLLTALAVSLAPAWTAPHPPSDSEDEVKAAAVWLFVQYSHLEPGADGAVTVGVMGRPSFAQTLRHTLSGKSASGHPVKVVDFKADLRCCQIVYLATDKPDDIRRALQSPSPPHLLTIGESDRFLEMGGAVYLFIAEGHIAFETNLEAVERGSVTISANLLKFGQIRNRGKAGASK